MGGRSVYFLEEKDKNFNVIFEEITNMGKNYILAQQYIKEASIGDKRIIVINGEVYKEAVIRKPNINDHRSNLAAGGTIEKYLLNKKEIGICNEIANYLKKEDIYFAGIDMIGDKITEINITVEGADTFFPVWTKQKWTEKSRINSTENGIEYSFVEYLRD